MYVVYHLTIWVIGEGLDREMAGEKKQLTHTGLVSLNVKF